MFEWREYGAGTKMYNDHGLGNQVMTEGPWWRGKGEWLVERGGASG